MAAQIAELLRHPHRANAQNALDLTDTLRAGAQEVENPEPVEITQALVDLHHMLAGLGLNCLHGLCLSLELSKRKQNNPQNGFFFIPATQLSDLLKLASRNSVRRFKLYEVTDTNSKPTGKTRQIS